MANCKNLSFIEPKQERSKKRFEEVLKTAEFIYTHQENYALTVQDVSKLTGMKRPSIYKFFPSNESILEALSFKYASDLFRLIKKNLNNLQYKDNKELIKVVIDVCAIYANKNHPFSNLIFNGGNCLDMWVGGQAVRLDGITQTLDQSKALEELQLSVESYYEGLE